MTLYLPLPSSSARSLAPVRSIAVMSWVSYRQVFLYWVQPEGNRSSPTLASFSVISYSPRPQTFTSARRNPGFTMNSRRTTTVEFALGVGYALSGALPASITPSVSAASPQPQFSTLSSAVTVASFATFRPSATTSSSLRAKQCIVVNLPSLVAVTRTYRAESLLASNTTGLSPGLGKSAAVWSAMSVDSLKSGSLAASILKRSGNPNPSLSACRRECIRIEASGCDRPRSTCTHLMSSDREVCAAW